MKEESIHLIKWMKYIHMCVRLFQIPNPNENSFDTFNLFYLKMSKRTPTSHIKLSLIELNRAQTAPAAHVEWTHRVVFQTVLFRLLDFILFKSTHQAVNVN